MLSARCSECGADNRDDASFCSRCGADIEVAVNPTSRKDLSRSGRSLAWALGVVLALVLVGGGVIWALTSSGDDGPTQISSDRDDPPDRSVESDSEAKVPPSMAPARTTPRAKVDPITTVSPETAPPEPTSPESTTPAPESTPPSSAPVTSPPPASTPCIDAATALTLAQPAFEGVTQAEGISCQHDVAVAALFWPDDDGVTAAYVNEPDGWRFIAGSFGLRSVCESVWSHDPTFDIGCGVNFTWPYDDYFSVPQLGAEAVRGTGCGGNGQIGPTIPDGIWNGYVLELTGDRIDFDLSCVYYGPSAQPFIDEYLATTPEDQRLDYNADYWLINNTIRGRSVPLADGFVYRAAEWREGRGCVDPGPSADVYARMPDDVIDSWLRIENGRAVWLLTSCPYG